MRFNSLSCPSLSGKSIIIFYLEQGCEIMDFIFPENGKVSGIGNNFPMAYSLYT